MEKSAKSLVDDDPLVIVFKVGFWSRSNGSICLNASMWLVVSEFEVVRVLMKAGNTE